MKWKNFQQNHKPDYGTRCLCQLTNNPNIYAVLVYIPPIDDKSNTWYCEINANYFSDNFVEQWIPIDEILCSTTY